MPAPPPIGDLLEFPNALGELTLLAIAGGVLGTWVVLRQLAFFSHAVGTATFPGLVVADAAGFSAHLAGLALALGYAGGVGRAGRVGRDRGDAATALLLVAALGTGIVLASDVFRSGSGVDRLLFGTLLGVDGVDLAVTAAAAAAAVAATLTLGRTWAAAGFDPDGASVLGVPSALADAALLGLVALAAVAALPAVGALLVSSLLVVPAATALLAARSIPALLGLSVAAALLQAAVGLYVALWLDVPPGPAVATTGAAVFALVALVPRRARA
jgi:manganese/iron transport system permease protein